MAKLANVRRINAFRALWRAVRAGHRPGSPGIGERFGALPRLVGGAVRGRYPGLGKGRLALFAVAIAYIVSPVDVMPEIVLTFLGLGDDAVVALWLAGSFLDETERFITWERTGQQNQLTPPA
ncbi:MAG TPA: YkvA family protein [Pseudonocardiaceae bacterium]